MFHDTINKKNKLSQWIAWGLLLLFLTVPLIYDPHIIDKYNPPKDHFFIGVFFITMFYLGIQGWMKKTPLLLEINRIDVLFSIFILFNIVPYFSELSWNSGFQVKFWVNLAFLGFYAFLRTFWIGRSKNRTVGFILIALLIITSILIAIGYVQVLQNKPPRGLFDNTGPYTNYLSVCIVLVAGGFWNGFYKGRALRAFIILVMVLTLGMLFLAKARTAWISTIVGLTLLFLNRYRLSGIFGGIRKYKAISFTVAFLLTIFLAGSLVKVYQYKKDSADGRLLIWKTTVETIARKPILGHGPESFLAERNKSQMAYFQKNRDAEREKYLADNIEYAFNDYLQITAETGVVGLFVFLLMMFLLLTGQSSSQQAGLYKIGLGVLLITSFFSYSLQKQSTQVLFVMLIASLNSELDYESKVRFSIKNIPLKIMATISILCAIVVFTKGVRNYYGLVRWKQTYAMYQNGSKQNALLFYNKVYPILKDNSYFLYNYGTVLHFEKLYPQSIQMLEASNRKLYDDDALMILGNSYRQVGNYTKAEQLYLESYYLIPHKFVPRYQLVNLYLETGRQKEAMQWAMDILNEEPKVPSQIVDDIKNEMVTVVSKLSKTP